MPWDDPFYDDGGWNPGDEIYQVDPGFGQIYDDTNPNQPTRPGFGDDFESGYQGGDSDGSIGSPTNPNDPAFDGGGIDWEKVLGAGANAFGAIFKALGITDKKGALDLLNLLGIGGTIAGGVNQREAIREAQERMERAASEANTAATDIIGKGTANFQPYIDSGRGALDKMTAFDASPLAAKFQATGGGAPSSLMDRFSAARSLGDVARIRR